jgi:hypothetical protein
MNFTIQRPFRILACLDMTAWQGNGPRDYPFGALALLREDLTVFYEHKGNALDETHIIHQRRTPPTPSHRGETIFSRRYHDQSAISVAK